ncbi:MAG TPA: beta-ketoacyl synthase N-terminal-like domain-containing protein, partial [Pseudomonadales bacterium]|nr:beta-ketoacyl synthase N-terminal-like domain-containing protein [Pseudomonadales bacterium]
MDSPIVITGMGVISPLGRGVGPVWRRLIEGQSGVRLIDRFDVCDFPVQIAGLVPGHEEDPEAGLDPDSVIGAKDRKKIDLFTLYALSAAEDALRQADW